MKCRHLIKRLGKSSLTSNFLVAKELFQGTAKKSSWFIYPFKMVTELPGCASSSRNYMKALFALAFVATTPFMSTTVSAQSMYLPPPPQGVGGEDSVTTQSGTHCRTSMNSNSGYFDVGVGRGQQNNAIPGYYSGFGPQSQDTALAYVRVVIPMGSAPKKLDCNRVLELEIQRLTAEIEMMKYEPD